MVPAVDGRTRDHHVGQRLRLRDQLADDRVPQVPGETLEGLGILGGFAAPGPREGDEPAVPLDRDQRRRPAGNRIARIGLDVHDDGEGAPEVLRGAEDPAGVHQARVDGPYGRPRHAEPGQPVRGVGGPAGGVDHQVRLHDPLLAAPLAHPDPGDAPRVTFQAQHLRTVDDGDPGQGPDGPADVPVQEVTAGDDHVVGGLRPAAEPALGENPTMFVGSAIRWAPSSMSRPMVPGSRLSIAAAPPDQSRWAWCAWGSPRRERGPSGSASRSTTTTSPNSASAAAVSMPARLPPMTTEVRGPAGGGAVLLMKSRSLDGPPARSGRGRR